MKNESITEKPIPLTADLTAPLTPREKRWLRRRRRVIFEEILGWILVPLILVSTYWLIEGILYMSGTSLSAIIKELSIYL